MSSLRRLASIVVPTHNRAASLERTLGALERQACPLSIFEVIVVADGCSDGTAALVARRDSGPLAIRLLEQPALGPAAARNRGVTAASGELLIFLDDDIEPWPGFVAAHVAAHGRGEASDVVAVGYLPPELQGRRDFFAIMLRAWWEAMFDRMRQPGHRFLYSDLLSGNFSVARRLFTAAGGFDESFRCHEDYELGLRLIAAGAQFQFIERAAGWHHEHTDLARALQRKRDEGQADVRLARKHPHLASVLPFSATHRHLTKRGRLLKKLAVTAPGAGDVLELACRALLDVLERCRARGPWRRLLDDLLSYWYWRGLSETLNGAPASSLRSEPPPAGPHDVDLRAGLQWAMRRLDADRPAAVRLFWGSTVIGVLSPHPGAEALRGGHLPLLLRDQFGEAFEETLALADLLGTSAVPGAHVPHCPDVHSQSA